MIKYDRANFVENLVHHEGLVLQVYQDTLGIDTIGVGRNLQDRGISDEELAEMGLPNIEAVYEQGITNDNAIYLACNDIVIVEEELAAAHPCVLELDAERQLVLMDMAFNMGVPRLKNFKNMWAAIHEQDFETASKEMLDSRWSKQVGRRSMILAAKMRNGI